MIDLKAVVKKERAKLPMAGDPGNGKTPEEIKKEILENREAMEASAVKKSATEAAKKQKEKAAIEAQAAKEKEESELLPVHTTKPIKEPVRRICPFCREEKSAQGMGRHIAAIHEAPGITLEDLNRIEQGEITPPDLLDEKGITTIVNLSPEVEKKHFSNWSDVEESPEDPEDQEDPESAAKAPGVEDNPGPPGDPSCSENPGNPELKEDFVERRKFNWIPFFSPFNRRSYRK